MNHKHFARSIASAALVAMLAVSVPAFAQASQGRPTNPSSTSSQGTTKGQQPMDQTNKGAATPVQCGASSPADTNENRGSSGSQPIESSGSASNSPSGPTTSGAGTSATDNADCTSGGTTSAPGSMINCGYRHAPNGEPARTRSATMNMNSCNVKGASMPITSGHSRMTNTLSDNPNGSNWMTKYNRPNVAATHRHHRTNALGATASPPKP